MTVARNYIRDLWRKEHRLIRFTTLSDLPENSIPGLSLPDPSGTRSFSSYLERYIDETGTSY